MAFRNNVNKNVLSALESRLQKIDNTTVQTTVNNIDNAQRTSSIYQLLDAVQEKYSSTVTQYNSLYEVFEQSIQNALIETQSTEKYDDFAELTVLYFIRDADRSGFLVTEIEDFLSRI